MLTARGTGTTSGSKRHNGSDMGHAQRRKQRRRNTANQREPDRHNQSGALHVDVRTACKRMHHEGAHQREQSVPKRDPNDACRRRKDESLREQLARKPQAVRTYSRAQRHLALTLYATSQQQPGHVDTRDAQQCKRSKRQQSQRLCLRPARLRGVAKEITLPVRPPSVSGYAFARFC